MDLEVKFDLFEIIETASQMKIKDLGVENALIIVEKRIDDSQCKAAILVGGKSSSDVIRMASKAMEADSNLLHMICLSAGVALSCADKKGKNNGRKG